MATDALGDRMKLFEGREAQRRALPRLPVLIRVDGKGFSRWTRGLKYPFDERLEAARQHVTRRLELSALPAKHHARQDPDMVVRRSEVRVLDMPVFSTVVNRAAVLTGVEPQTC